MDNSRSFIVHVVDDDEAVRDSIGALLESHGIEVRAYPSAMEFLVVSRVQPKGCLLVDVHMPGMTGMELLQELKAQGSKLPIILMTGCGNALLKEFAVRAGAVAVLEKPVPQETLLGSLAIAQARSSSV